MTADPTDRPEPGLSEDGSPPPRGASYTIRHPEGVTNRLASAPGVAEAVQRRGAQDGELRPEGGPQQEGEDSMAVLTALMAEGLAYRRRISEVRSKQRSVRFTESELETIEATAAALGLRPASFISESAVVLARLGEDARPYLLGKADLVQELFAANTAIGRVGNNINQLARLANSGGGISEDLHRLLAQLSEVAVHVDGLIAEIARS